MHKLNGKIVKFELVNTEDVVKEVIEPKLLSRPEYINGSTYKVKSPDSEHALYITINNILINEGTDKEKLVPFEIFLNSKNMEHFQWMLALTRLISAVFRRGGDVTFLTSELMAVFDPKGGYFKKGGVYMPSLISEIGYVIEQHMINIGYIKKEEDTHMEAFLDLKREEAGVVKGEFPESAQMCNKCNTKAVVTLDGCLTCLNCGESKCG